MYPNPTAVRPIAFLPPSSFAGPCVGNVYTRGDSGPKVPRYSVTDHGSLPRDYLDLDGATGEEVTFLPREQFDSSSINRRSSRSPWTVLPNDDDRCYRHRLDRMRG